MIWKKKNAAMQGDAPSAAAANDKTAGKLAGAKAFARKNWKWLLPAAVVVLAGGVFLLKPAKDKQANVDTSYVETLNIFCLYTSIIVIVSSDIIFYCIFFPIIALCIYVTIM